MGFIEPLTVKQVIENIYRKNYLLPAIQREFVWNEDQITRLFDSLMKGYPIGSFLFWKVEKENIQNYQFYDFLQNYHERDNKHNQKVNLNGNSSVTAILDGQQRLTALYIGLKGSYAYKEPRKRWDNDLAFPKRRLYLNLLKEAEDSDYLFDFKFLKQDELKENDTHFWFPVGDILNFKDVDFVITYLTDDNSIFPYEKRKLRFASKVLLKFYNLIHNEKIINGFLEQDKNLDKVLNIFIRVNSGGTQLNYSDLLLSIATAQWKYKDAREEITLFYEEINSIGQGFTVNKDFILKSCLVLSGLKKIAFKVDNFNKENMLLIEKKWEDIKNALRSSYLLLSSLGYNRENLTSNNAIIPLAIYLLNLGSPDNFSISNKYISDRTLISKWLSMALLKKVFSGQPDNIIRPIREIINQNPKGFPFTQIVDKLRGTPKSMVFTDDDIYNLFFNKYGQSYTFQSLVPLYPTLDFNNKFHQDHIFPKHLFTVKKLMKKGYSAEKIKFFMDNYNCLANLQMLEGIPNQEKSGKDFKLWITEKYPDLEGRKDYMKKHYIPDVDFSLDNFDEFIKARKKLMTLEYNKILKF